MGYQGDLARFFAKVEKTGGCWIWKGAKIPKGYGRFYFKGKPRYAHRVSLELHGVYVPDHLDVMHSCDTPSCVNPAHLSVGTKSDNMKDASTKGRVVSNTDWSGQNNPKSKLSVSDHTLIRNDILSGVRPVEIARKFNVTKERIYQLRNAI